MKKLLLIFLFPIILQAQFVALLSDNTDSLVADFTFTDVALAYSYTEYISDSIIVSRINVPTSISVSNCFYRKGLNGSFTNSSSTVSLGDTVWLMDTTGATGSTYGGTLTIGGVSDTWAVNCPLQALVLDGTQLAYRDSVSVGFDQTESGGEDLTIEGSFYADTLGSNYLLNLGGYGIGSNYDRATIYIASGTARAYVRDGGGLSKYVSITIEDSTWYTFKMQIKKSVDSLVFSIVGLDTLSISTVDLADLNYSNGDSQELTIGGYRYNPPAGYWIGQIGSLTFTVGSNITKFDWSGDVSAWLKDKGNQGNDLTGIGLE